MFQTNLIIIIIIKLALTIKGPLWEHHNRNINIDQHAEGAAACVSACLYGD